MRAPRRLLPIAILALLTHGFAFAYLKTPPSPDAAEYLALGKSLATKGELVLPSGDRAKRMPLYPALLSFLHRGASDEQFESRALALQYVLAGAGTLVIALVAGRLAGPRAERLAGIISAIYGPFLYLQTLCLTETLLILLLASALWAYLIHLQSSGAIRSASLAAGAALLALASLTRANAALLVVPFCIDAALRSGAFRIRIGRAVALALPACIALTAWGLRNQSAVGSFTISTIGGLNLYLGHNEHYASDPGLGSADYGAFDRLRRETGHSEVAVDRELRNRAVEFASAHCMTTLMNTARKAWVYHSSTLKASAPSLLLIIFAAILLATHRAGGRQDRVKTRLRLLSQVALLITILFWIPIAWMTLHPWINPSHLVPVGLAALLVLRTKTPVRGLFIGLYVAQMLTALVTIPLVRLRWSVDMLLIVAIAAGVARLCDWIDAKPAQHA